MIEELIKTARASYQHGDIIECLYNGERYEVNLCKDKIDNQGDRIWLLPYKGTNILLYENKKWAKIITRPSDKNVRARQELSMLLTRQAALLKELNTINKRIIKSYEEIN